MVFDSLQPHPVVDPVQTVTLAQKPRDAVEYAWDYLTKRCIWAVNEGLDKERADWTMQYWIDVGDVEPSKKLAYEQMVEEWRRAGQVVEEDSTDDLGDSETSGAEIRDLYADMDEDELTQDPVISEEEEP